MNSFSTACLPLPQFHPRTLLLCIDVPNLERTFNPDAVVDRAHQMWVSVVEITAGAVADRLHSGERKSVIAHGQVRGSMVPVFKYQAITQQLL